MQEAVTFYLLGCLPAVFIAGSERHRTAAKQYCQLQQRPYNEVWEFFLSTLLSWGMVLLYIEMLAEENE